MVATSAADGSSALMPITRVGHARAAAAATRPACVPPEELAWTMTSGIELRGEFGDRQGKRERAGRGVDAPSGITTGRSPAARASARSDPWRVRGPRATRRSGPRRRAGRRAARWRSAIRRAAVGHERAAHAQPGRGGRRDAGVVRLHAAARDEHVGPVGERPPRHERQLANLVAAEPERDGVVPLDEEPGAAAEGRPQARAIRRASGIRGQERRQGTCAARASARKGHGRP
jgi:hypothetical protein